MEPLIESLGNSSESVFSLNFSQIPTTQPQPIGTPQLAFILFRVGMFLSFYYVGLFFPFGLIFNFLLLLVFAMSPVGTTKTTRVYYMAMAYGELMTVFFKDAYLFWASLGFPFVFGGFNLIGTLNLLTHRDFSWLCSVQGFMWWAHEMFANYMFLLFEFERVVAIYSPFRVHRYFTLKGTLITVFFIGVIIALLCVPLFWIQAPRYIGADYLPPFGTYCLIVSTVPTWGVFAVILPIAIYLVPPVLYVVLTILLCWRLLFKQSLVSKFTTNSGNTMPIKEIKASINVLLMALLHLIFYVPLACIRVLALFASALNAPLTISLALNGATFLFYEVSWSFWVSKQKLKELSPCPTVAATMINS